MPVTLLLAGLLAGCLSGFLGLGGGAALVPCFALLGGMEQHRAQLLSLAVLLPPVALPALLAYKKAGVRLHVPTVVRMAFGFVMGGWCGARLANWASGPRLAIGFASFLLLLGAREWLQGSAKSKAEPALSDRDFFSSSSPGVAAAVGLAGGIWGGALGVGGAVVMIPLLMKFMRYSRIEAQACTLAIAIPPLGLPAVLEYARLHGPIPWANVAIVALAFAASARAAGRLAPGLEPRHIARAFALVLLAISGSIFYRALVLHA